MEAKGDLERLVRRLVSNDLEERLAYQCKQDAKNDGLCHEDMRAVQILREMRELIREEETKPPQKWDQIKLNLG